MLLIVARFRKALLAVGTMGGKTLRLRFLQSAIVALRHQGRRGTIRPDTTKTNDSLSLV